MWRTSLLFVCLLCEVVSAQLNGNGSTTGVFGGEAHYYCSLPEDMSGVLQVTWQRMHEDESLENLATYSQRFGSQINEPHLGKVEFTKASLSSTAITVTNLTWEDEACYVCTFNTYPSGSHRKQTCLTVEGISHVKTDAQQGSRDVRGGESQVVFTCSATGRPAPTIRWNRPGEPSVATVQNDDNTFTTTSNLTLNLTLPYSAGHIDCLVNSVMRQRIEIPVLSDKRTEHYSGHEKSHLVIMIVVITLVVFVLCAAAAAVIRRKRQDSKKARKTALKHNILLQECPVVKPVTKEEDVFEVGVQVLSANAQDSFAFVFVEDKK